MPEPKKKLTRTRSRHRRGGQNKLKLSARAICQHCQAKVTPHTVCQNCGFYKGEKIINP